MPSPLRHDFPEERKEWSSDLWREAVVDLVRWAENGQPAISAKDFGALGDDSADDTTAIQSACTAAGAAGGGIVFLPAGTYIVDLTQTVGTGGAQQKAAIVVPSNVMLLGAGMGQTTIKLKAVSRAAGPQTASIIVNSDPNGGNTGVFVRDLTIDGNRLNQGPYVWTLQLAVYSLWSIRGISYWGVTDGAVENVFFKNMPEHACFLESGCARVRVGDVRLQDVVSGVALDVATDCVVSGVIARNTDAAVTVNTTSTTSVTGGTTVTVTPASMTGITTGMVLMVALGTNAFEYVLVTATTGSTFDAFFGFSHSGTWTIKSARFPCDAVTQAANGVARCVFSNVEIDYSSSIVPSGPACEVFGAKGIVVANYFVKGTWAGVWVHNWTVSAVKFMVEDVSVTGITTVNLQTSRGGVRPASILVDDNGYTGVGEEARNISCSGLTSRWGKDGAAIPTDASGIVVVGGNVMGFAATGIVVDSAYTGLTFIGSTEIDVSGAQIRNTRANGIYIAGGLSRSAFSAITIIDPGRSTVTDETPGILMVGDASLQNKWNVFSGINIKNAGKVSPVRGAIDLSTGTPANNLQNLFIGMELSNNVGPALNGGAASNRVIDPNSDTTTDIASAGTITLPAHASFFNITGTTGITSITASWPSRNVQLKFAGILTVTDGSNLKLAGNFTTSADDMLELVCDGVNWYELGRSVN
jgi:pectate lyase-like protein